MVKKYTKYFLYTGLIWLVYLIIIFPRPLFDAPLSTVVYDSSGDLLGAKTALDGQWRFSKIDSVPYKFEKSIITYEDKRYYYHLGFDPLAIAGAIINNLNKTQKRGGSTITMQTMRLALKNKNRNLLSKLEEISLSFFIEIIYSKQNILKLYTSYAPFGGNVVGLEAASWRYYQKSPHLLTWSEAATLAVLPNAPSLIHPGKNRERLLKKRNTLLALLYEQRVIDRGEYELALIEEIPLKPKSLPQITPHLVDYLFSQNKSGKAYETYIDREVQESINEIVSHHVIQNIQNNINNIAVLVLNNNNGEVISYYGNNYNGKHGKVDMIHAKRSSGSILKPMLYCAMMDDGKMTSKALLKDTPISINGYAPLNFDKNFRGALNADEALQRSLNVPFVLMLKEYGIDKAIHKFRNIGLSTINKSGSHYGLSLILGGAEVSLWELCGVYSSMARTLNHFNTNQSKYDIYDFHIPQITASVTKSYLQFKPTHFNAGSLYEMFDALKNLERPNEEGLWQEFNSTKNIAWKTGTSFGHKDAWAIGVDAQYTIGVWVGNADGTPRTNLTGISMAAPLLFDIFNRLPSHKWFDIPYDDLKKEKLCKISGHIANTACEDVDDRYISIPTTKSPKCPYHNLIYISCDEQYQVYQECYPQNEISKKSYLLLTPDVLAYYRDYHPSYKDVPDFHPDCLDLVFENKKKEFAIIYPSSYTKILLPKDITGIDQTAVFRASHNDKDATLHWHIDDQYIGTTSIYHSIKITHSKGKHKLTVMDDYGNQQVQFYEVI